MKPLGKAVKNEEFKGKLYYLCQFPDPSAHQNHHNGQAAGISKHLLIGWLSSSTTIYERDEDEQKTYKVERSCLLTTQSCWKKIRQCLDIDSGQQKRK